MLTVLKIVPPSISVALTGLVWLCQRCTSNTTCRCCRMERTDNSSNDATSIVIYENDVCINRSHSPSWHDHQL